MKRIFMFMAFTAGIFLGNNIVFAQQADLLQPPDSDIIRVPENQQADSDLSSRLREFIADREVTTPLSERYNLIEDEINNNQIWSPLCKRSEQLVIVCKTF